MELIIYVLMLFIFLNCIVKLSMWRWWQRLIYSSALGGFVLWSERYAVLQSKTQIADYLQNAVALQNMAIVVTLESVLSFAYIATYFQGSTSAVATPSFMRRATQAVNLVSGAGGGLLLMFPVLFYLLTQAIFALTGVDFGTTSMLIAAVAFLLVPLLAEGAKWLLPEADGRIEVQLLLSIFVCVLGLLSTQNGKMIYAAKDEPLDINMICIALATFALLFAVGVAYGRLRWHLSQRRA